MGNITKSILRMGTLRCRVFLWPDQLTQLASPTPSPACSDIHLLLGTEVRFTLFVYRCSEGGSILEILLWWISVYTSHWLNVSSFPQKWLPEAEQINPKSTSWFPNRLKSCFWASRNNIYHTLMLREGAPDGVLWFSRSVFALSSTEEGSWRLTLYRELWPSDSSDSDFWERCFLDRKGQAQLSQIFAFPLLPASCDQGWEASG